MLHDTKYTEYLIQELNLSKSYYDDWSEGGTYGTCWDEDGPSKLEADTEMTYLQFNEYHIVLKDLMKYFNIKTTLEDAIETHKYSLYTDEIDECDYYGGCETRGKISFDTDKLINSILKEKCNKENLTVHEAQELLPEYFL